LVYINGIPLVNIELKGPTVSISDAYNDNLKDYKDTIPKLRWYNAFVILSNGSQTKVGTFSSPWNFFKEWKRLDEKDNGDTSIETTIKGMMTKEYLMDIFENFILHEEKEGKVINIVAQNHQYL
jgi:type I restriction enzyme R subunit